VSCPITGTFTASGQASGTTALAAIWWDANGTHFSCAGVNFGWHATRQG
jgi:hypothetical protein